MLKANRSYVLLLLIFTFSFVYRMLLMLWDGFPPGADIGLHNSVIYSITGSGNVDFLYNFYHIGGGISLTFPGYHIFTAGVIMFSGLPEYIAHAAVVALFSSLIVVSVFLITKRVWSISAAFIVAFLAAISRFDIEMLMWAGYPNVITLLLIPITFYLYIGKDRFSKVPFFISTSILVSSLFLTHSLSAAMFGAITGATMLIVLIYPNRLEGSRKTVYYWILPIVFGAILVSPFLVQAIPMYLAQYGSSEIAAATVATRILPLEVVLPLFGITAAFFVFSKKFYKKFLVLPTLLLALWVFLPLILTQGYLVGLPVDYNRFLYFLVLPVLIFIAVLIEVGSGFFAGAITKYRASRKPQIEKVIVHKKLGSISASIGHALTRKRLYSIFVLSFLLFSFVALPIFCTPSLNVGEGLQNYYQTMDNYKWEALQWLRENTTQGSVLVSDALYGWWLGGFAQRPTISAVSPEYLTVKREVDNATFARNLLDTDYIVDNGLIQVRDDGYLSRHNPEIVVKQNWTYAGYSFFTFNSSDIGILYNVDGVEDLRYVTLDELPIKETWIEEYSDHVNIVVVQGNEFLNYTRTTTVYGGLQFVTISSTLRALVPGVTFGSVTMLVQTTGLQVPYNDKVTVGIVETGTKDFGQLIFKTPPAVMPKFSYANPTSEVVKGVNLQYLFNGASEAQIDIIAIAYSATNEQYYYDNEGERNKFFADRMTENVNSDMTPKVAAFDIFDYRQEVKARSISYVILSIKEEESNSDKTELDIDPKFRDDPLFSLVFINPEVAIYKVNGNLNQG